MFWGVSLPWYLLGAMALGFWLMLSPAVFGSEGLLADSGHLIGALVVSFTVMATAEPARALRFVNVPLGGWVVVAPWLLGAPSTLALANGVVVGVALVALNVPRGKIRDHYGFWQGYIV
jgi:hypothetical protein